MTVRQQLAVQNDCYRRNQGEMGKNPGERDSRYARYYQGPQGVMIHSTGAENPNLRRYVQPDDGTLGVNPNGNDWNRPGLDVAVHAFIGLTRSGEVAAYQILPWEYRAWHCGGSGNDTHLSIEICEDNLQDRGYFDRVYQMAMELTAELCRRFRLDPLAPGVVVDHAEGAALGSIPMAGLEPSTILSTYCCGVTPAALALSSIFWPCSSAPVRNMTSQPCRRL